MAILWKGLEDHLGVWEFGSYQLTDIIWKLSGHAGVFKALGSYFGSWGAFRSFGSGGVGKISGNSVEQ